MKKNLFLIFLLLTSTITIPSNTQDISVEQISISDVLAEVDQAIDELNYEKLASMLEKVGPLSKEAKGLPLLRLYKLRDDVFVEGANLREKLLVDARVLDVDTEALFWSAVLSFAVGIGTGVGALGVRDLTLFNRVLLGLVSLGCSAHCSCTMGILAQKNYKKIADMNGLIEPFNKKLEIIKKMIDLLEYHPES